MTWQPYALSLAVGLGVGVVYGLIAVRSPAPPIIAILGLIGMLAGEALVQWIKGHPDVLSQALHRKTFAIVKTFDKPAPTAVAATRKEINDVET